MGSAIGREQSCPPNLLLLPKANTWGGLITGQMAVGNVALFIHRVSGLGCEARRWGVSRQAETLTPAAGSTRETYPKRLWSIPLSTPKLRFTVARSSSDDSSNASSSRPVLVSCRPAPLRRSPRHRLVPVGASGARTPSPVVARWTASAWTVSMATLPCLVTGQWGL